MNVARANAPRSRLNDCLRGYLHAEWWQRVDSDVGAYPAQWAAAALSALMLAKAQWLREVGRIHIVGIGYACVKDDQERWHCVFQITYSRLAAIRELPPASTSSSADAVAGAGGGITDGSPRSRPVARQISPSLCGNEW